MKQSKAPPLLEHEHDRRPSTQRREPRRRAIVEQGAVVWVTGLPASGKSTFGRALVEALKDADLPTCLLDGDDVRASLEPKLGYDDGGRNAFYKTLAALASLLAWQGLVVVVAATAHRRAYRERARALAPAFVEVFVDVPLDECRRRDAKGLYDGVWLGTVCSLPGTQVDYEAPEWPDVVARHGDDSATLAQTVNAVRGRMVRAPSGRALEMRPRHR